MKAPLVLDIDGSVGVLPGATVLDLRDWHEALRFACSTGRLRAAVQALDARMPREHGTAFLGSGDFHHLSWPLIERQRARGPFDVVVFDNHPDNMRFPFGIHCGSWVRRVALLPYVAHVHVVGITSGDVGAAHAWENYLTPLRRAKLTYWTIGVDTGWSKRLGLIHAFRAFDDASALLDAFAAQRRTATLPVYLSIDKDVLSADVAHTNWDQGCLLDTHLFDAIESLRGRVFASDITGDVSVHRYATRWKRWLSALDDQPEIDPAQLVLWQSQQHALNLRLLDRIAAASAES